MNIDNLRAIATLFHVSAEPPAVEVDGSGVWEVTASSAPPFSPLGAGLVLTLSGRGDKDVNQVQALLGARS